MSSSLVLSPAPCPEATAQGQPARRKTSSAESQPSYEELRRSEAHFRHLTEYSLDLITILEADGTIRFESRSIERELGHRPGHYRGRNAFEFVHPDDRAAVLAAFQEAVQRRGGTPLLRFRFRHADGSYRMLEGSGNNLLDDPAVRGIVFNSRDITERVRLQEDVERARAEKEETIALLTGGVAHDFNNILTSIQGHAELSLNRVAEGSEEARYLRSIREATRRAADLTRQLLAFSRRVVLQPRSLPFDSWVKGLAPRLRASLGPLIELSIASNCHCNVWEDADQLEQVVLHLALNAREAMPAGGCLSLRGEVVVLDPEDRPADGRAGAASFIRLQISDQGCGMSESILPRIFDPYFTTKTTGNHSGLGLSMCRGIVEQSDGFLTVRSSPGQGTVFQLFLRITDLPSEERPVPEVVARGPRSVTVLFADDEPMLREIGEAILTEAGYRVILAEDGPGALAGFSDLQGAPLDLLVTDVVMPGMTGIQLAEEVARLSPATHVLLCSGYTRDALARNGELPAGMSFLAKPYTLTSLMDKVQELLRVA